MKSGFSFSGGFLMTVKKNLGLLPIKDSAGNDRPFIAYINPEENKEIPFLNQGQRWTKDVCNSVKKAKGGQKMSAIVLRMPKWSKEDVCNSVKKAKGGQKMSAIVLRRPKMDKRCLQ
ncbi:hypothetical protein CEXT_669361 [Caerostris extrusa]|uniref:Uncharacterized protein n=1 Tax=Caerostris extrusa TaxID=172846 RepID=A0AAV4RFU2_CAEEX|nr:hypothetical protein CEXT_669361 [Caerostris extrusa]